MVLKTIDELYEAGRNGEGEVRDLDPEQDTGAFIRDQKLKRNTGFYQPIIRNTII